MLPPDNATFRPEPTPERLWHWDLTNSAGEPVAVAGELADQRFTNQADAESWVGEIWAELADAGVDAVTLKEGDRVVYGPMSLHA